MVEVCTYIIYILYIYICNVYSCIFMYIFVYMIYRQLTGNTVTLMVVLASAVCRYALP